MSTKTKPTVLMLSTYPYKRPFHGGQHRLQALARAYEQAGTKVHSLVIYEPESYGEDVTFTDIAFPLESPYRKYQGKYIPLINDYLTGEFLLHDEQAWKQFRQFVLQHNIRIIHFEHPWLFPAVKKLKAELGNQLYLIFGSANIESQLKKEILKQYDLDGEKGIDLLLKNIEKREIAAAQGSDVTLVVTANDEAWFHEHAPGCRTILVQNGVRVFSDSPEARQQIRERLGAGRYVVYVGSAHPPNLEGFIKCVGDSLACIPPDCRFVLVGTISEHIERYLLASPLRYLNESRLVSLGKVELTAVDAAIEESSGILLPITTGGGSNLKTAEALVSQKPLIATTKAFRGFETYCNLANIFMADSKQEFRNHIRRVLQEPLPTRSPSEQDKTQALLWENVTQPLKLHLQQEVL